MKALNAGKETELEDKMQLLAQDRRVMLQWVPAHCGIPGNEQADDLAKQGAQKEQFESCLSYHEKKTIIKTTARPRVEKDDYHHLKREEQVTILRLRSGHNRLNHHMAEKLKLVPSPLCACGEENQTGEHILQRCALYRDLRKTVWPTETALQTKLYGPRVELEKTCYCGSLTQLTV